MSTYFSGEGNIGSAPEFHEYPNGNDLSGAEQLASEICDDAKAAGLRTLILPLDLDDAFRVSCD